RRPARHALLVRRRGDRRGHRQRFRRRLRRQSPSRMSNDSGPAPDTDISGVPVPAPSATAWFHCFAGIAGDMALGSLLDAGADLDEVVDMVRRLPLGGWALEAEPVLRGGIAATRAIVRVTEDSVVRTHSHIVGLIEE